MSATGNDKPVAASFTWIIDAPKAPPAAIQPDYGQLFWTEGEAFQQQYVVRGSTADYTFSATGLPDGLSMSASGMLSGVPASVGFHQVLIGASAAGSDPLWIVLNLTISPAKKPPVDYSIGPVSFDQATQGSPFAARISVSPDDGDSYEFTASGLPDGMTLGLDGTFEGTPATAGSYTLHVTAQPAHKNAAIEGTIQWEVLADSSVSSEQPSSEPSSSEPSSSEPSSSEPSSSEPPSSEQPSSEQPSSESPPTDLPPVEPLEGAPFPRQ